MEIVMLSPFIMLYLYFWTSKSFTSSTNSFILVDNSLYKPFLNNLIKALSLIFTVPLFSLI